MTAAAPPNLMFTGCRLNEIHKLKQSYFDLKLKIILLSDCRTGKKTIYLCKPLSKISNDLRKLSAIPISSSATLPDDT
jgi:hypothetical protein